MDLDAPITTATWLVPTLGILASLAYALRERAMRTRLLAAASLENERQESVAQAHLLARLTAMDTRIAQVQQELESERTESRRVRWELEDTNRLQAVQIRELEGTNRLQAEQIRELTSTVSELGADKTRLARRIIELEQEVDAANKRAVNMKQELETSLELKKPSTLSERPGRGST
jgi:septal ring factor EnvC (AmiA/AmiB activator)